MQSTNCLKLFNNLEDPNFGPAISKDIFLIVISASITPPTPTTLTCCIGRVTWPLHTCACNMFGICKESERTLTCVCIIFGICRESERTLNQGNSFWKLFGPASFRLDSMFFPYSPPHTPISCNKKTSPCCAPDRERAQARPSQICPQRGARHWAFLFLQGIHSRYFPGDTTFRNFQLSDAFRNRILIHCAN